MRKYPFGVEGFGLVFGMLVADQHLWPARADLAVDKLDLRQAGPAVGIGGVIAVPRRSDRRYRDFGRAVNPRDYCRFEIGCRPADQRRRHRGAAADEQLQAGQPGPGVLGRGSEQLLEERRGASHVGAPFGVHQRDRVVGVPAVHQHRGGAQQQRAFERVDGTADMGDRRRHQERVAGFDQPVSRSWQISAWIELWVCSTPFGRPVVPEV